MANEVQVVRAQSRVEAEHTRNRKVFIPRVDIVESKEAIVLTADMPGVDEKNVNVTLEKGVLTITRNTKSAITNAPLPCPTRSTRTGSKRP